MKRLSQVFLVTLLFSAQAGWCQNKVSRIVDAGLAVGTLQGSMAVSLNYEKSLGARQKVAVGIGVRFTSYAGRDQYYLTAPAELTSGSTGPLVLFKENILENMDTFLVRSPQINAVNLMVILGYNVSDKLSIRFNIDAIGFSFGKTVKGNYINSSQNVIEAAEPTSFNVLLISDNDKGSLNSELFARYGLSERLAVKAGLQFLFTEYTTSSAVQQFPEANDRFRNKSLMFCAGLSFNLQEW